MEELRKLLEDILNEDLQAIVVSGPRTKGAYVRLRIRPLAHRGSLLFQVAATDGKKEYHTNYQKEELAGNLLVWMSRDYRQLQAETTALTASALVSKKGKVTVKKKKRIGQSERVSLEHNRQKQYLLPEGEPVPFLVQLGVMTPEGRVVRAKYDKFRQINRFLEFIDDICPALDRGRELSMIDFGCGKSYLTFAMYYYLHEKKGFDLRITGLDLKEDVIEHCNALAEEFGYEKLKFQTGDIADYEGAEQADLVVTLHACDTATDYALAKAVAWNAKAILSVPCCQHELNGQIVNETLQPVLKYGLLKERMAALVTDGLRASMLEEAGYSVQVLEFIDMEHTPKNILIRAVREPKKFSYKKRGQQEQRSQGDALRQCMEALQVKPTLYRLLKGQMELHGGVIKTQQEEAGSVELRRLKLDFQEISIERQTQEPEDAGVREQQQLQIVDAREQQRKLLKGDPEKQQQLQIVDGKPERIDPNKQRGLGSIDASELQSEPEGADTGEPQKEEERQR